MLEMIIFFGIPLILAGILLNCSLERAWIFFTSSLLTGYMVFCLQPYVIEKLLLYLPESAHCWISVIALPGIGLFLLILLCIIFSRILPQNNGKISYPQLFSKPLQFLCIGGGALVCMAMLTLSLATVAQIGKMTQTRLLQFSNLIFPCLIKTVQCGTPKTPLQTVWLEKFPTILYLANRNRLTPKTPIIVQKKKKDSKKDSNAKSEKNSDSDASHHNSQNTLKDLIYFMKEAK